MPIRHIMDGGFAGVREIGDLVSLIARVFDISFQDLEFFHDLFVGAIV